MHMPKTETTPAQELANLADLIENTPNNRHLIAKAVRMVATAMKPCEDCGKEAPPTAGHSEVIDPADNPEAGA